MTEKLRQSLSAAMDDEADAFELRRVLDELGRDDELKALWDRFHVIGNVLRGGTAELSVGLRERVWAALEIDADVPLPAAEAALEASAPTPTGRFRLGRYTGLAVAASVAFAVVIGLSDLGSGGDSAAVPTVAAGGAGEPIVAQRAVPEDAAAQVSLAQEVSPSDVQRAHAYMLHHAQQQALNQAGVMSFVKLATYEAP